MRRIVGLRVPLRIIHVDQIARRYAANVTQLYMIVGYLNAVGMLNEFLHPQPRGSTPNLIHQRLRVFPFQAVAVILASALRGAGDVRATMFITMFSTWVLRVGAGYFFGVYLGWGLFGIWLGWCSDFLVRAALILMRFRAGHWKAVKV